MSSCKITEYTVVSCHLTRLLTFAYWCHYCNAFVVWRKFAVVIPEVEFTTNVMFLTSITCFQNVDLSSSFFASKLSVHSFTGESHMVRFQWARISVAFTCINCMTEHSTSFTSMLGWSTLSVSCLGSTIAGSTAS